MPNPFVIEFAAGLILVAYGLWDFFLGHLQGWKTDLLFALIGAVFLAMGGFFVVGVLLDRQRRHRRY